jgi:hypothetical protein
VPYVVQQWPGTVYPDEVRDECPEAEHVIDALILRMRAEGPSPDGYGVKTLGKAMGGLWQINLRVEGRHVRVLYAPYGQLIMIFRIHKKPSKQEQNRAYALAKTRKSQYERTRDGQKPGNKGRRVVH